jgi:hypothetical protein
MSTKSTKNTKKFYTGKKTDLAKSKIMIFDPTFRAFRVFRGQKNLFSLKPLPALDKLHRFVA